LIVKIPDPPNYSKFEAELDAFLESRHAGLLEEIRDKKKLDDGIKSKIESVLKDFKGGFSV